MAPRLPLQSQALQAYQGMRVSAGVLLAFVGVASAGLPAPTGLRLELLSNPLGVDRRVRVLSLLHDQQLRQGLQFMWDHRHTPAYEAAYGAT